MGTTEEPQNLCLSCTVPLWDGKLGIYPLTPMPHWFKTALGNFSTPQLPGYAMPWPWRKPGGGTADRHHKGPLGSHYEHPTVHHCTKSVGQKAWTGHTKPLQETNRSHFRALSSLPFNVYQLRNLEGRLIAFGNSTELGVENKIYEYQVLKGLKRLEWWTRFKDEI